MKIAAFWENPEKINQRSFANLRTQGIITVKLESFPPRFPRQTPKFNVPAEHASCAPGRPSRLSEARSSRRALQEHLCDTYHRNTHTHTDTHFQVQGLEKGVSENEAPGPIGAYTATHDDTITLMPNLIHRISFTESHSQN